MKKLILISSILGTSLLVFGCTPNAASVSKALIHAQEDANQQGSPNEPINNFSELNSQSALKLSFAVVKNDRDAAISLLANKAFIDLSDDSNNWSAFDSLIKGGIPTPLTINPSPAQILILVNDDEVKDLSLAFQSGECALKLAPLGGPSWELSLGSSQGSCVHDRNQIQEIFIVPVTNESPGSTNNNISNN